MEFWGAEVKVGEPLLVSPGEEKILHLSQACLGESKSKGSEPVVLYVKVGNQKLVLGTLSSEKFPQVSFDLVFDKEFELSHNWKNGSVHFTGYTSLLPEEEESTYTDSEEDFPLAVTDNGKPEPEPEPKKDAKPDTSGTKKKVQIVEPSKVASNSNIDSKKNKDSSDEDDDEDEESTDNENENGGEEDDSDDDENESSGVDSEDSDEDSDDSLEEDEQTPKKAEASKKRPLDSANKTPAPDKKAKLVTPQKTDGKKGVAHVATPHPSKKAGKMAAANDKNKQQTPKSANAAFSCKTCNSENKL
ncbi:histone deacetylase HDT1 isoform X2 [Cucumis sativus]|uniref:histone deacetylase HDT1 isoform X2 n=1 Tax=Cucumis sativus TaxID=3659 RepID=UPI0012F49AF4|nr:histone deacetylase HDT1 isoform X2 [Cucumis sativus]